MAIAVARAPSMPGLIRARSNGENRTPSSGIQCVTSANELKQSTRLQHCPLFATHLHSNARRKCGRLVIVCGAGDKLFNQRSLAAFQAEIDKLSDAVGITTCARGLSQIETHKPERGSSVRTNAGRNKKWRTLEKGRLEGNKRTRGNENTRKPKAPPPPSPGPAQEGDANESEGERPAKEPRVKPRKGPKPKERVTFAGQDMLLLNMGDRNKVGGDVEPWASVRTERMPDDYYKYGPFGPHAWKGVSVGSPRKGTLCDNLVVFFSTVENEEEHDLEDIQDAITGYAKRLDQMDEDLGIQYYFVFVRQVAKVPNLAPWEEWTLVAQVAVESESELLEKWSLGSRLDRSMWKLLTRCVAWYRPDLVYVKKPAYQVRFEPQKEFIEEWISLLDPGNASSFYYERLCELLGVGEKENAEQAAATFDGFGEARKGKCIEHVLTSHPVCLLTPFTQEAFKAEKQEKTTLSGELDSMEAVESSDTDEDEADEEFDPFDGEFGEELDFGEADDGQFMGKEWEREEAKALAAEEAVQKNSSLTLDADEEDFKAEIAMASTKEQEAETEELEPFLDAALRPFTYTNLIKEIFIIRSAMVEFAEMSG